MKTVIDISTADRSEQAALQALYHCWGYGGQIDPADEVYVARDGDHIVGLVRRTFEHGVTLLRGMQIRADRRRLGIGSRMLERFVADLAGRECYCLPYTHLTGFYGQVGFGVVDAPDAPVFIAERLAAYRSEGRNVLIMRRERD